MVIAPVRPSSFLLFLLRLCGICGHSRPLRDCLLRLLELAIVSRDVADGVVFLPAALRARDGRRGALLGRIFVLVVIVLDVLACVVRSALTTMRSLVSCPSSVAAAAAAVRCKLDVPRLQAGGR